MPCPAAYQRTRGWPGAAAISRFEAGAPHLVVRPARLQEQLRPRPAEPVRGHRPAAAGQDPHRGQARLVAGKDRIGLAAEREADDPGLVRVDVAAGGQHVERTS